MTWTVTLHRAVQKQLSKLPGKVVDTLEQLLADIEFFGPVRGNWPNYSKLADDRHHCHLKKGKPTYVVGVERGQEYYNGGGNLVGSHEKAPY